MADDFFETHLNKLLIGLLFVLLNFPNTLQRVINTAVGEKTALSAFVSGIVYLVGSIMVRLESLFRMRDLMALLFLLMLIYLLLGVALTIRCSQKPITLKKTNHQRARWEPTAVIVPLFIGLFMGCFGVHLFAWVFNIIFWFL